VAKKRLVIEVLVFTCSNAKGICVIALLLSTVAELYNEILLDCSSITGKVNEYFENRKTMVSKMVKEASHFPESVVLVQCC
jgi:hypothetical protein